LRTAAAGLLHAHEHVDVGVLAVADVVDERHLFADVVVVTSVAVEEYPHHLARHRR
jgi:hypothetical protein